MEETEPVLGPSSQKGVQKEVIVTATVDDGAETRTSLLVDKDNDDEILEVRWSPGDEIKVFSAGESSKFTSLNTEPQKTAQFKGTVSFITGLDESGEPEYVWGLYPYREDATCTKTADGTVITTTLPSYQRGAADTFSDDLALAIGRSRTLSIPFKNVYTGFRFTLTRDDIVSVTFRGNNNETLAGRFSVSMGNDNEPVIREVTNPDNSVTLYMGDGEVFEAGPTYYMVFKPNVFSKGYSVTVTRRDGKVGVFTITSSRTFSRNKFSRVKNLDNSTRIPAWNSPTTQGVNEIWYTTTDNEPVEYNTRYSTVGNVVDTENCVAPADNDGVGIIRFEAPLTTVDNEAFYNKSTMATVSLPETVEVIGEQAFFYCTSLAEIRMDHVKTIKYGAFDQCKFTELILPPTLEYLSYGAFWDCYDLTRVVLPESLVSIGLYEGFSNIIGNPFPYCFNIESFEGKYAEDGGRCLIAEIDGQEVLLGFASGGLDGESYSFPEGIEDVGCFAATYSTLGEIVIPKSVKQIRDYAFAGMDNLQSVTIQSELDVIGGQVFRDNEQLTNVIINSKTIPRMVTFGYGTGGQFFNTHQNLKIYVPINRIKYYKSAEYWETYEDKFEEFVPFDDYAFNFYMLDPRNGYDQDENGVISRVEAEEITELLYHGGDKSNCLLEGIGVSGWRGYYQPDGSNAPKYYCYGTVSTLGGIQYLTNLDRLAIVECPTLRWGSQLGQLRNLTMLQLDDLPFYSLAFLKNMTELTFLEVNLMPYIEEVDLANNNQLALLQIKNSGLTKLDVSNKTDLTRVDCENNKITELILSGCTKLKILNCQNNLIETLDVSENLLLESFKCFPMNDSSGNNVLMSIFISPWQDTDPWVKPTGTQYIIVE
jgi:hypothetical protein